MVESEGVWCPRDKMWDDNMAPRGDDCVVLVSWSGSYSNCYAQFSNGYVDTVNLSNIRNPKECGTCRYRLYRISGVECPGCPEK
jgi:hypothetical protein